MNDSLLDEEKKFYERFWALHRNADLLEVFEKYGPEVFRRSSVLEDFETFIDAQCFNGKLCVEIGTLNGLTSIVLARRFDKVVTIDVVNSVFTHDIARLLGIKNIEFIPVHDNADKAYVIAGLGFDAAYVDGDHIRDTESDFALVRRCGRVLLHEYWDAQPAVVSLVKRLRTQGNVVTKGKLALWTN